jgi:hypothetical protein
MSEIVHATRVPLIALERHEVALDGALLARARAELLEHGRQEPGSPSGACATDGASSSR